MPNTSLNHVFGVATHVNAASYFDRGGLDARLHYYLRTERHVAIHGDSKQGKTWLRANVLNAADALVVQCGIESTPGVDVSGSARTAGHSGSNPAGRDVPISGTARSQGSGGRCQPEFVNPYEASAGENQGVSCGFSWLVSGWLIHATSGIVGG